MAVCYIGLGSNLGNRRQNIRSAIARMNRLDKTKVMKISSLIETLPESGPPQGNFINAVVEIDTHLSPRALLAHLQKIESALGRSRTVKNGPRTIDLDILLYDDKRIEEKDLVVPHPRMTQREFVLAPLKEIAPHVFQPLKHASHKNR